MKFSNCLILIRRLEKRLPRMPFPPKTVDTDFDFEAIIDRKVLQKLSAVYIPQHLQKMTLYRGP